MFISLRHLAPTATLVLKAAPSFVQVAPLSTRGPTGSHQSTLVKHPYFVPRNNRGHLPVYTDIRNGGTRYLVLIRNVDGNADLLARDLTDSLFEQDTPESERMKIDIVRGKNLIITGGRWKNRVAEWLQARGF
ncbi:hypothetical protein AX17_003322 [Amanita inopinata Kibby_2008]|nr:hypothetical protein AX17_003322 [Amanita inopinata Kibby_2008]